MDLPNQRVVVQPGVINLWVTQRVAPAGYYYAPDPIQPARLLASAATSLRTRAGRTA